MSHAGCRWYVVHTQPNGENRAAAHLERQGFKTYLPRYRKRRRHARRVEMVASPLFPRYMFVAIDMAVQRWRSIYSTVGVSRIVTVGDEPTPVTDALIADLKARENDGLIELNNRPSFRLGDKLRVLDGAFADCLGLYDGLSDSDRIRILLDLLGRKVRVMLDIDAVATA
jgi:transcriptional antiterminator RfaH